MEVMFLKRQQEEEVRGDGASPSETLALMGTEEAVRNGYNEQVCLICESLNPMPAVTSALEFGQSKEIHKGAILKCR